MDIGKSIAMLSDAERNHSIEILLNAEKWRKQAIRLSKYFSGTGPPGMLPRNRFDIAACGYLTSS